MKIKLKKLDPNACDPIIKRSDDFCFDVKAVSVEELHKGILRYHTGIGMQIVRDEEELGQCVLEVEKPYYNSDEDVVKVVDQHIGQLKLDFKNSPIKLDIDFRPRSSVWETGLVLCNCEPTIDEPYTGEIMLNFYQVVEPDDVIKPYEVGDKIGQFKVGFTLPLEFEWVDELDKTSRGADGFGSSGRK